MRLSFIFHKSCERMTVPLEIPGLEFMCRSLVSLGSLYLNYYQIRGNRVLFSFISKERIWLQKGLNALYYQSCTFKI